MKKISVGFILTLIVIGVIGWFLRPFWHPFLMSFVISPLKFLLVIFVIIGLVMLIKKFGKIRVVQTGPGSWGLKASNHISGATVALYVGLLALILFGLAIESEVRYLVTAKEIKYETKKALPEFNLIRLTPKQVASRYAEDSFQSPQERLGDSQISLVDGKLVRIFPKVPDGGLLYLINKMSGFVTVDVDTLERKVNIQNQEFKYSEGIGITDNIYFQLLKKKYFVSYTSEPIYLKNDAGKWVTVVPYMTYKGLLFRVPEWGGVMVVESDGSMADYTPQEAQKISYLKGNRIYPKELTNYYAHSYSYLGGLLNKWFIHKNQVEIVSLPNDESIIHASTKEGFKQIVVAEPYGQSYGIYKIFLFDATTGKREVISYDENSQLTGPVAAADYIKRAFPTYNWNNFQLAEPRPVTVKGQLNWLLSIIPNDSAGIATTVLFDAKTNKVTEVKTEAELKDLLAGKTEVKEKSETATQQPDAKAQVQEKINEIQKELDDLKGLVAK